ncbi:hypothetical protein CWI84_00435 [Idiomarina tyrosinivorans]|uniref:Uncharacterized protein n=1 Tax=Idiomarina tyrosinivorans TaxID=1445662 RepID=A0A432ZTQ2_9GAMM|nr:hypothetical protein [Idiomarina tyrosinivorans]RUO81263.1 hypothetical protein CWI84_00435 [Idiomarina tyrosinivorans]
MERIKYSCLWLLPVVLCIAIVVGTSAISEPINLNKNSEYFWLDLFTSVGGLLIIVGLAMIIFKILVGDMFTRYSFDDQGLYKSRFGKVERILFSETFGVRFSDSKLVRDCVKSVIFVLKNGQRKSLPLGFSPSDDQLKKLSNLAGRLE